MLERAQPMEQVNLDGGRFIREAKVSLHPARLLSVWGFVFAVSPTSLHPLPNETFLFCYLLMNIFLLIWKTELIDVCSPKRASVYLGTMEIGFVNLTGFYKFFVTKK